MIFTGMTIQELLIIIKASSFLLEKNYQLVLKDESLNSEMKIFKLISKVVKQHRGCPFIDI